MSATPQARPDEVDPLPELSASHVEKEIEAVVRKQKESTGLLQRVMLSVVRLSILVISAANYFELKRKVEPIRKGISFW